MTDRSVHYEAAFEDFLRRRGCPCVPVDQAKRAIFAEAKIKSFDFLVYSSCGPNLVADVKGRKFTVGPAGAVKGGRAYENWVTREDIESLRQWEQVFGDGFAAVLVFAYWLQGPLRRAPFQDIHIFRDRHYAFMGILLGDYVVAAQPRSAKWQTLCLPTRQFLQKARDIAAFL